MTELIRSGDIQIKNGFQNVSYILGDDRFFLVSGYKMLKARETKGLLKCSRILYNGKVTLCYRTGNLKPISSMYGFLNFEAFLTVMSKVIDIILEVRGSGFLKAENLDLAFDRIFVESRDFSVAVVYLPINAASDSGSDPEMEFRSSLHDLIRSLPLYFSFAADRVCNVLKDGTKTLKDVKMFIDQTCREQSGGPEVYRVERLHDGTNSLGANLRLISQNRNMELTLHDHSYEYVIGKTSGSAEGVIPVSSVSRKHCAIYFTHGKYYIEDLDSTNGTYVNGERLPSHQKKQIIKGDLVRIANIPFRVDC